MDQQPSRRWAGKAENGWPGFSGEGAIQDSPAAACARQRKAHPWSAPRLRGRGEQGNIVMHT
jgi:hypothetical protein